MLTLTNKFGKSVTVAIGDKAYFLGVNFSSYGIVTKITDKSIFIHSEIYNRTRRVNFNQFINESDY